MTPNEPRDPDAPDRQDESPHNSYRVQLETLETRMTTLLETVTGDETLEPETKQTAKRHCRELRAELECVRRELPTVDHAAGSSRNAQNGVVTVVSSPLDAAYAELWRRTQRDTEADAADHGTDRSPSR